MPTALDLRTESASRPFSERILPRIGATGQSSSLAGSAMALISRPMARASRTACEALGIVSRSHVCCGGHCHAVGEISVDFALDTNCANRPRSWLGGPNLGHGRRTRPSLALITTGNVMNCQELIAAHATLYSAILRELKAMGAEARFRNVIEWKFAASKTAFVFGQRFAHEAPSIGFSSWRGRRPISAQTTRRVTMWAILGPAGGIRAARTRAAESCAVTSLLAVIEGGRCWMGI
jgi:hypothetical protein